MNGKGKGRFRIETMTIKYRLQRIKDKLSIKFNQSYIYTNMETKKHTKRKRERKAYRQREADTSRGNNWF